MTRAILLAILLIFIIAPLDAKTILVLGDSLSAAYGLNEQEGWVTLLRERLKAESYPYQLINLSTSGDTTSNGLAKLSAAITTHQPIIVIIELGANDGLRGLPIKEIRRNLEEIIQQSQKHRAKVLLLATLLPPNYGSVYLKQFNDVYRDLAEKYQLPWVPMFLKGVAGDPLLMQKDGLHPNQRAQEIILENVWPSLAPLL